MTATEARKKFYDVIETAKQPGVFVVITHDGLPEAVVMSFEDFEGWRETMEIRSDRSLDRDIRKGIREMKSGIYTDTMDLKDFKKKLKL